MYSFDPTTKQLAKSSGRILTTPVVVSGRAKMRCVLYEPAAPTEKSRIGIVLIHSDEDYSDFPIAAALAERGYRCLAGQVSDPGGPLEQKLLDVKHALEFLKSLPGVEKLALLGHSGGATLMSAYQAAAEKGVGLWARNELLYPLRLNEDLISADAMLLLDSNFGNGAMTLFSIDPAVIEEGNGQKLDPALDIFNPQNGYDPEQPDYSDAFLKDFFRAQRERNNAIIRRALDRLTLLEQGKGNYIDDEPFPVTGAAQFMIANKLIPQDVRLLAHTKAPWPLLHADGRVTREIIFCRRLPRGGRSVTPLLHFGVMSTVRAFLSNRAVLAAEDYGIHPNGVTGVCWDGTYTCTPGNVRHVSVPMLILGMTGSYEYLAAEEIFHSAASEDKTLAFVDGAGHNFHAAGREAEFGHTENVVYDTCDRFLSEHL
ncbi:MAG: alpha/beta hydrolase [Clostridia bacterium]|nr:alpha/beta hydrolase [Clostridia bacterium]